MLKRSSCTGKRVLDQCRPAIAATTLPLRCVCQFSSTCKSHQHQPAPAEPSPGQANVQAYDRLFAGIAISSPPPEAQDGDYGITPRKPHVSRGSISYGPAFSRMPASPRPPSRAVKNRQLNPADLAAFRQSLDAFFPDTQNDTSTAAGKQETDSTEAKPHFGWAEMLDKVEASDKLPRDRKQTPVPGLADYSSQAPSRLDLGELPAAKLQLDVAAEQEAEALKEEFASLRSPVDVVRFTQERLFGPGGLAEKVSDASNPVGGRLYATFPFLLTDVSRSLRSSAPNAALLPLKLASSYSPASYFHGCTTTLYVSTMKTRWEVWGDIEGSLALMKEMDRGAVNIDVRVVALVKAMQDAVFKDRQRAERQANMQGSPPKGLESTLDALAQGEGSDPMARPAPALADRRTDAEEKAHERLVEQFIYFSPSERRALQEMEKIIVESRERQQVERMKEYDLQDVIRAQSKVNAGTGTQSSVNNLINSYGSLDRPKSAAKYVDELRPPMDSERGGPGRRSARADRQSERRPHKPPQGLDVLSQAVSELSQISGKKKDKRYKPKSRSKSSQGPKGRAKRDVATASDSAQPAQ